MNALERIDEQMNALRHQLEELEKKKIQVADNDLEETYHKLLRFVHQYFYYNPRSYQLSLVYFNRVEKSYTMRTDKPSHITIYYTTYDFSSNTHYKETTQRAEIRGIDSPYSASATKFLNNFFYDSIIIDDMKSTIAEVKAALDKRKPGLFDFSNRDRSELNILFKNKLALDSNYGNL